MHLWLSDYGRVILVLGLCFCLAYPLTRRFLSGATKAPFSVLLGAALLSLVVCLLSWVHLFTRASMLVVAALAAAATAPALAIDIRRWRNPSRPGPALSICLGALLIVVAGFSWFVLYPVTVGDAVNYHLPLARDLVVHHGLRYDPFVRYSFFPQANEALFALVLMLDGGATAAGALEWGLLSVAAFALLLWFPASGRRTGAGFAAALVLLASPAMVWVGTSPMIDAGTAAFVLAGMLLGLDAAEERVAILPGFLGAGLLLGAAAASKYTALVSDLASAVAILIVAGRPRRLGAPLLALLGGGIITALPWYAWTLHTTGDPVYPFATSIFGNRHGLWTPSELQLQAVASRGVAQNSVVAIVKEDIQFLLGHVVYNTGKQRSPLSWWLGSGYLGLLLRGARRDRDFLATALAGLIAIGAWIFSSAGPRYLLPAAGLLALLGGLAADHGLALWDRHRPAALASARLAPLWCAAACAALLWTSVGYVKWYIGYAGGGPPTGGPAVGAYLRAQVFCYPAVSWLNDQLDSHYRVWAYNCEGARYYTKGLLISDAFSVGGRDRVLPPDGIFEPGGTLPSPRALWKRLEPLHVGWMIVPTQTAAARSRLDGSRLFRYATTAGPEDIFEVAPRIRSA